MGCRHFGRHVGSALSIALLISGSACAPGPTSSPAQDSAPSPAASHLSPSEQLIRVSMALRGVRPSLDDLDEIEASPSQLGSLASGYLDSPEFGKTIRDLHAETLLVRAADGLEYAVRMPNVGPLEDYSLGEIHRSLTEAPLRMVERIVMEDQPYTEVLRAGWTMTDPIHSTVWGLDHDPDGPPWQVSTWNDGRPDAGLLSSSAVWARYVNNGVNNGRGRANFVARAFLCQDFFGRDIPIDHPDDLGSQSVSEEATTLPACLSCHVALDPLASFFWVFRDKHLALDALDGYTDCAVDAFVSQDHAVSGGNCYPFLSYWEAAGTGWQNVGMPPPAYFGTKGEDLSDLGRLISEDGRFSLCTARRFEGFFTKQLPEEVPFERASTLQSSLLASDWSARDLVRQIVLNPSFLGAEPVSPSPDGAVPSLVVSPHQLASLVDDLTGFRWIYSADDGADCHPTSLDQDTSEVVWGCWGDTEIPTSAAYGVRAIAGGIDGYRTTTPSYSASPGLVLLQQRLAEESSAFVVARDFELAPEERRLFADIGPEDTDPAAVGAQIQLLSQRLYGAQLSVNDLDITELMELFDASLDDPSCDTTTAWTTVLTVMLQDPRILLY